MEQGTTDAAVLQFYANNGGSRMFADEYLTPPVRPDRVAHAIAATGARAVAIGPIAVGYLFHPERP